MDTTRPRPQTYDHLEDAVISARKAYQPAHNAGAESDIASCADYFGWHAAVKAATDVVLADLRERLVKQRDRFRRDAKTARAKGDVEFVAYLQGRSEAFAAALSYLDEVTR